MSERSHARSPLESARIISVGVILAMGSFVSKSISPEHMVEAQSSQPVDMAVSSHNLEVEAGGSISLNVPTLDKKMAESYLSSTVRIEIKPKSNPELFKKSCAGIYMGEGIVATAAHCTRIMRDKDGNEYGVTSADGKDLRKVTIRHRGNNYSAGKEKYFPDYNLGRVDLDVDLVTVDALTQKNLQNVPLADKKAELGDAVYMNGLFGYDQSHIYRGRVVGLPEPGKETLEVMYEVDEPEPTGCRPGTSGTGVLDAEGRLSGINVARTPVRKITPELAQQYNLHESSVGKTTILCVVVPIDTLRLLVGNDSQRLQEQSGQ